MKRPWRHQNPTWKTYTNRRPTNYTGLRLLHWSRGLWYWNSRTDANWSWFHERGLRTMAGSIKMCTHLKQIRFPPTRTLRPIAREYTADRPYDRRTWFGRGPTWWHSQRRASFSRTWSRLENRQAEIVSEHRLLLSARQIFIRFDFSFDQLRNNFYRIFFSFFPNDISFYRVHPNSWGVCTSLTPTSCTSTTCYRIFSYCLVITSILSLAARPAESTNRPMRPKQIKGWDTFPVKQNLDSSRLQFEIFTKNYRIVLSFLLNDISF